MPLFGRSEDLAALEKRCEESGLTAITGRPLQGKSYLLRVLCRQLALKGFLLGYFEANRAPEDMLLRCVVDLHENWLADSTWRQQARQLYEKHRGNLISGMAKGVGEILLASAEDVKLPLAKSAREVFQKLLQADRVLKTSGLDLPPLSSEQAKEILQTVQKVTGGKTIVLVFDAWEQSGNVEVQQAFFEQFLGDWRSWPTMHILVASRDRDRENQDIFDLPWKLKKASARADVYPLDPMRLAPGSDEEARLVTYLHAVLPVTKEVDESKIAEWHGGYPGVLSRWFDADPQTPQDLQRLATEAQEQRFEELRERLLPDLLDEGKATHRFALAARLALLPEMVQPELWDKLRSVACEDLADAETVILELASLGVLYFQGENDRPETSRDVPRFGHTRRYEVAQKWFLVDERARPHSRRQASTLIRLLAGNIKKTDPTVIYFSLALASMERLTSVLELGAEEKALCYANKTLLGQTDASGPALLLNQAQRIADHLPATRSLLTMGLLNTLNHAKKENDLTLRDALLEELRKLQSSYADDPAVRGSSWRRAFSTR